MKKHFIHALLALCVVCGAFCLREKSQPQTMRIPVTQVFSYPPEPTQTPLEQYGEKRERERGEAIAALQTLSQEGDDRAEEYMLKLVDRNEKEMAVEGALAAMGYAQAVCAIREKAVSICLQEKLGEEQAQKIMELCVKMTGECIENVFLMDECGYLW
ncbi:MAG: SpoIIIAH-like family protein [Clostridia bacterium]|nr:SpoIIIAH-like family protein [Clostridia bacterium]